MVKKSLSDLLQEEAQKFTPAEGEAAIDVAATAVNEENTASAEESSAQTPEPTASKRTNITKADLEATVKELKATLEQANKKEKSLQRQIADLQSALSDKEASAERLAKELDEAKNTALQLAEVNYKLIEEVNGLKQEKEKKPVKKEPETPKPVPYRKSYRRTEILPQTQPDEGADTGSQMWLLD